MLDEPTQSIEPWNGAKMEPLGRLCVHHLFEQQVEAKPEAIAVTQEKSLTYGELNAQANQLAHHLIALGVRPNDRIAIFLERSIAMVVGLLATLKAGGAYIPLDPAYPATRIQQILDDALPTLLLTDSGGRAALGEAALRGLPALDLTIESPPWSRNSRANLQPLGLTSDNLAYVIYTSGSTGAPKGVLMAHAPLVNLLNWHAAQTLGGLQAKKTLQFAALGFDVAFQEIFSTLGFGGELVLMAEQQRSDFLTVLEIVADHGIERLHLPFVALRGVAQAAFKIDEKRLDCLASSLKDIFTAGEQLVISDDLRRFFRRLPRCRLHNQYGPTESHVAIAFTLPPEVEAWPTLPPIGRPIANARVYLLNEMSQPVPPGSVGEIYIGGVGVARGYLNKPELTSERFISSTFVAGDRLYRTGDLARCGADGQIEFLGRNDDQVKIRGFRVEPGEIEARLLEYAEICEAIVISRDDSSGDKYLVAYVVTYSADVDGVDGLASALRTHLIARLPEYMVPKSFVALDSLPLTPNGKLDRRALPEPDDVAFARPTFEPPRGDAEQAIANIWADLLGLERIGRHDNFFELGGHSMQALRLLWQLQEVTGSYVSPEVLFEQPTLAELALAISPTSQSASNAH